MAQLPFCNKPNGRVWLKEAFSCINAIAAVLLLFSFTSCLKSKPETSNKKDNDTLLCVNLIVGEYSNHLFKQNQIVQDWAKQNLFYVLKRGILNRSDTSLLIATISVPCKLIAHEDLCAFVNQKDTDDLERFSHTAIDFKGIVKVDSGYNVDFIVYGLMSDKKQRAYYSAIGVTVKDTAYDCLFANKTGYSASYFISSEKDSLWVQSRSIGLH